MKNLLQYLRGYRKECIIAPGFKMLEAIFDLFVPLVMASIINNAIPNQDTGHLLRQCLLLLLLAVIGLSCSICAQYFAARAAVGFSGKLRSALFRHIEQLSNSQLEQIGTSTLITRMTSDINQVQNGVNMVLRLFLRSPFIVFGALIMAFTINTRCALIFAAAIPILFIIVFGIMAYTIPGYRTVQSNLDRIMLKTRENLTGVRVIRAFCRESSETEEFNTLNAQLNRSQQTVGRISGLMNPLTYITINLAVVAILWQSGMSINVGSMQSGDVVALVNYSAQILVELVKLANLVVIITRCAASATRISDILSIEPEEVFGSTTNLPQCENAVSFCDVSIAYHSQSKESLSNVSFLAKSGQTIGIIGGTGSGKSTLVNLIPRMYDHTSGSIQIFGKDIFDYDLEYLRQIVGVVPQKALLFSGTIRSNLTFGAPNATDDELWDALELAQAADFVRQKPLGLDEPVEQGGRNFSGGQRQRLTIARALIPHPPILILDDSASALDYATDAKLRRALRAIPYAPTVFIVSQRISSLQHADLIIVLEDGTVAGQGTHQELLAECPVYQEIYRSQNRRGGVQA